MSERDIAREIEQRLNADPTIRALLGSFTPRDPRYRYWETPDGRMFIYTTEKMGDGKYASAIYVPYGKGSRSGKRNVTQWRAQREVHHATRKAAKARALKLYTQAKGVVCCISSTHSASTGRTSSTPSRGCTLTASTATTTRGMAPAGACADARGRARRKRSAPSSPASPPRMRSRDEGITWNMSIVPAQGLVEWPDLDRARRRWQ